jgi:hypothetical protein
MMRRRHALALLALPHGLAGACETSADLWVDLTPMPAAGLDPRKPHERRLAQQAQVMSQLRALGAIELGRVQLPRAALAVRLPCAQLDAARHLPGVRRLRPVRDVPRSPPAPKG